VISPEKRIETAIEIVDRVRAGGADMRLRILGSTRDRRYLRRIQALIAACPWITLQPDLPRPGLLEAIARCRYGLHAMADGHFGIGVAEMAASGSIPFVPNDGGQVEVVGGDARLVYDSVDEAAAKILRVHGDALAQDDLRARLRDRAQAFSWPVFRERLRALVADFVSSRS